MKFGNYPFNYDCQNNTDCDTEKEIKFINQV